MLFRLWLGERLPSKPNERKICSSSFFTVLHPEKAHEVRVHRSCGWIKHKRECYKADNADHLETVCQCFGDMCNTATSHLKVTEFCVVAALLATFRNWRI